MTIEILRPGLYTTVQDLGRPGLRSIGVPGGGAMDAWSLRLANRLVGNADDEAGLEITLTGPELRFPEPALVALTGSRFECALDGRPAAAFESLLVPGGGILSIGRTLEGARGILAVAGGIAVPRVLGSRSTLAAGAFGGLEGRPLRRGDRLPLGEAPPRPRRRARPRALFRWQPLSQVRAIAGPQVERFADESRASFFSAVFRVDARSDRAGLRLDGPVLRHSGRPDLLPEGVLPGSVQVPGDGQAIVLGVDGPTTGGYAKIATIVSADWPLVARAKPGDHLRFVETTREESLRAWREREELLASVVEELR